MSFHPFVTKRLLTEVNLLITDPHVQTYFHYESPENIDTSKQFRIYGYLLPRTEPDKYGSYKVCITFPYEFPFKPPQLHLITYIYHPTVDDNTSKPKWCTNCCPPERKPTDRIGRWIEHYVNQIDRPGVVLNYCLRNSEASQLYYQNKAQYKKKL